MAGTLIASGGKSTGCHLSGSGFRRKNIIFLWNPFSVVSDSPNVGESEKRKRGRVDGTITAFAVIVPFIIRRSPRLIQLASGSGPDSKSYFKIFKYFEIARLGAPVQARSIQS
ncbi:hypothetical protein DSO57_1023787 [Entomophthora muscae]|uniref:Uncharacterized protein n=1 Tax=Entomophthora muscae TaxID=34485 RepID=A0ACC2U1U2_9FUNG|nr:hypothetical protein DSO57_1023787 [Entomophthora muscae]